MNPASTSPFAWSLPGAPQPPMSVHRSSLLWVGAIGAYLLTSLISLVMTFSYAYAATTVGAVFGLIIAAAIAVGMFYTVVQLRRGTNWARIVLAVLGGLGAIAQIIGLFGTLALMSLLGVFAVLSVILSLVTLAFLVGALVFMFQAEANSWFAAQSQTPGPQPGATR